MSEQKTTSSYTVCNICHHFRDGLTKEYEDLKALFKEACRYRPGEDHLSTRSVTERLDNRVKLMIEKANQNGGSLILTRSEVYKHFLCHDASGFLKEFENRIVFNE